ncbi:hypothetical protein [Natronorubrum halophilum]|uniref:hypothetical protein n=1 Tax=Natronorubrum halophilum TaxID=1702106 RepID=UPI0013CE74D4|nr:hypothetical protein [Natronorubrum halophilum]
MNDFESTVCCVFYRLRGAGVARESSDAHPPSNSGRKRRILEVRTISRTERNG